MERFAPVDAVWWDAHLAGKTFHIQIGSRVLSDCTSPDERAARPVRFRTLFRRQSDWAAITETDDILLLRYVEYVKPSPDGGLVFVTQQVSYHWASWGIFCFDSGGVDGCTEVAVKACLYDSRSRGCEADVLRFHRLTPQGAEETGCEETDGRVKFVP